MSVPRPIQSNTGFAAEARRSLVAAMPVTEQHIRLAGIDTPILRGGSGSPIVLLHGPSAYAAHWLRLIPELVPHHQVIAPDLPGHGESEATNVELDVERTLSWLGELIERCCTSPPVVVGQVLGGAIAARFATRHGERISRLVLVDTFGLADFAPEPLFATAIHAFFEKPAPGTHTDLWKQCVFDVADLRSQLGPLWDSLETYNLDRASTPSVMSAVLALMKQFGVAIPPEELSRIRVPVTLIWGRQDRGTSLRIAEAASARYGWPLLVIENAADEPSMEQPTAFLQALRRALGEQS